MPVVTLVRDWNAAPVPALPVALLVAAEQQHGVAARVERKQHAQMPSDRSELLHVVVARAFDRVRERTTEPGPGPLELVDRGRDPLGVALAKPHEPSLRLRRQLDLPSPR